MMHALIKGGIPAIYDIGKSDTRLLYLKKSGYDSNPDGLFELYKSNLMERFPDDLDGEAVKIQDQQWEALKDKQAQNGLFVIYMTRDKESVLQSYAAFTGSTDLTEVSERYDNQLSIIDSIQARSDVTYLFKLNYEAVVRAPRYYFKLLKNNGLPINHLKAASVVKSEYHHFRECYAI